MGLSYAELQEIPSVIIESPPSPPLLFGPLFICICLLTAIIFILLLRRIY